MAILSQFLLVTCLIRCFAAVGSSYILTFQLQYLHSLSFCILTNKMKSSLLKLFHHLRINLTKQQQKNTICFLIDEFILIHSLMRQNYVENHRKTNPISKVLSSTKWGFLNEIFLIYTFSNNEDR